MNNRKYQCTLIIGYRGMGKSTFLVDFIQKYHEAHKELSIYLHDPNFTFMQSESALSKINKVPVQVLNIDDEHPAECIKECTNGLLILDDLRVHFGSSNYTDISKACIQARHKNLDIVLVYHSFSQVHKRLLDLIDNFVVFHVKEPYEQAKNRGLPLHITKDIYEKFYTLKQGEYIFIKN